MKAAAAAAQPHPVFKFDEGRVATEAKLSTSHPIFKLVAEGSVVEVQAALRRDPPTATIQHPSTKETPLMRAVRNKDPQVLQSILEAKGNPAAQSAYGFTAMDEAAQLGNIPCLELLKPFVTRIPRELVRSCVVFGTATRRID